MQQLLELEARLHGGAVTVDLDKYKVDRFGDVRSFCIGEVDPVCGYTGSAAAAAAVAMDDEFLVTGGAARGAPAGRGASSAEAGGWPAPQRPSAPPLDCCTSSSAATAGSDGAAGAPGTMVVASASDVPAYDSGSLRAPGSVTVTDIVRPPPPAPSFVPAPVLEPSIEEGAGMRALSIDDNVAGPGFQVTAVAASVPQEPPVTTAGAPRSSGTAARARLQAPQWSFDTAISSASGAPAIRSGVAAAGSSGSGGEAGAGSVRRPLRKRKTKYTFGEDTSDDEATPVPAAAASRGGEVEPPVLPAAPLCPSTPAMQSHHDANSGTAWSPVAAGGAAHQPAVVTAAVAASPVGPSIHPLSIGGAEAAASPPPARQAHHRPQMSGLSMVSVTTGISTGGSSGHASVGSGDVPMGSGFLHGTAPGAVVPPREWRHGGTDLAGLVASVVAASPPLAGTGMAVIRGGLSPPTHPSAGRPRRGSTGGMVIERFATAGHRTGTGGTGAGSGDAHYSPLATSPTVTHTVTSLASLSGSGSGGGGSSRSLMTSGTGSDAVSLHAASAAGSSGTAPGAGTGTATASACCVSRVLSPLPLQRVALTGSPMDERGVAAWTSRGRVMSSEAAASGAAHGSVPAQDALGRFMAGAAMVSPPPSTGRSGVTMSHAHRSSGGVASPPPLAGSPGRSSGTDAAHHQRQTLQLPMPAPVSSVSRLPVSARAAFGSGSSTGRSAGSPGGFTGGAAGAGRPRRASTTGIDITTEVLAPLQHASGADPAHHRAYR